MQQRQNRCEADGGTKDDNVLVNGAFGEGETGENRNKKAIEDNTT
jgi:hypothetical protein